MIIHLECSGGFSGIPLKIRLDTLTLDPQQDRALQGLLDSAQFFSLPEKLPPGAPGADRFQYKITVETEAARHTVEAGESGLPGPLLVLVQQVTRLGPDHLRRPGQV
jgi:hypothetical protein